MGMNFSFLVVTERGSVDRLLEALLAHLGAGDSAALERALPWQPTAGCLSLPGLRPRQPGDYPVQLAFAPDAPLEALVEGSHARRADRIDVSVWATLDVGEHFALLRATAPATRISLALEVSRAARTAWRTLAETAGARAVFLDAEETPGHPNRLLWPYDRVVALPAMDDHWIGDSLEIDVDAFARRLLALVDH